jgi:hypothetical protein
VVPLTNAVPPAVKVSVVIAAVDFHK